MASDNPKSAGFWAGCSESTAPDLSMLMLSMLGLCHCGFDPPWYSVMQQHVFPHNPHMEKKTWKGDPVFMLALLYLMLALWHVCRVWSERKTQTKGDSNHGVIILFNFHNQLCQRPSKCMWMRLRDLLLHIHSSANQHYTVINILQASALGFFVCVCLHWMSPLPSLGMAVVNYNYAKKTSAHTAASSEKCSLYACLLAVGRSQLFGVWFWSHACSLLMEFPWLQSRLNLHGSEIPVRPHECKLLSGSHTYWSGRVIITPVQSSSTSFIADIPLKTC